MKLLIDILLSFLKCFFYAFKLIRNCSGGFKLKIKIKSTKLVFLQSLFRILWIHIIGSLTVTSWSRCRPLSIRLTSPDSTFRVTGLTGVGDYIIQTKRVSCSNWIKYLARVSAGNHCNANTLSRIWSQMTMDIYWESGIIYFQSSRQLAISLWYFLIW